MPTANANNAPIAEKTLRAHSGNHGHTVTTNATVRFKNTTTPSVGITNSPLPPEARYAAQVTTPISSNPSSMMPLARERLARRRLKNRSSLRSLRSSGSAGTFCCLHSCNRAQTAPSLGARLRSQSKGLTTVQFLRHDARRFSARYLNCTTLRKAPPFLSPPLAVYSWRRRRMAHGDTARGAAPGGF